MTYSTSQGSLFADESTSLPEDSLANHSQPPESEKGEMMSDISSPRCFELFERLSPATSSLKTFVGCLVSNLDEYSPRLSHNWKGKVSKSSHFVFLLAPSGPRTDETGSGSSDGLLLTPRASEHVENRERFVERNGDRTMDCFPNLATQIGLLGTPTSTNRERSPETMQRQMENNRPGRTQPPTLREQTGLLRTPCNRDHHPSGGRYSPDNPTKNKPQIQLAHQIQMLRTPSANEPGVKVERLQTKDGGPAKIGETAYDKENGRQAQVGLSQQIQMLPTPTAEFDQGFESDSKRNSPSLNTTIQMLPTPSTNDISGGANKVKIENGRAIRDAGTIEHSANLQSIVASLLPPEMIATPRTSDYKGSSSKTVEKGRNPITNSCQDAVENSPDGTRTGLKLQPAFVEYMMAFPLNWTSLEQETTE
jgi:hypothetical protein